MPWFSGTRDLKQPAGSLVLEDLETLQDGNHGLRRLLCDIWCHGFQLTGAKKLTQKIHVKDKLDDNIH